MLKTIKKYRARKAQDQKDDPKGAGWFALIPVVIVTVAGLVFIPQICANQRDQQLLEHGQPAVAEIVSVRETGNRYNRQPEVELELRVQPTDGAAFSLAVTKVLSQSELAQYVQGSFVEVRYDPARSDSVALVGPAQPPVAKLEPSP